MKRKVINILIGLLFLTGFGILAYPTISDQWNTYRQSRLISGYEAAVAKMEEEDFEEAWEAARAYNGTFAKNSIHSDVFGVGGDTDIQDTEYWKVLNVSGDGIMGYLTIPKINIRLSVYHGTAEDVIQTGVGHPSDRVRPGSGDLIHLHPLRGQQPQAPGAGASGSLRRRAGAGASGIHGAGRPELLHVISARRSRSDGFGDSDLAAGDKKEGNARE